MLNSRLKEETFTKLSMQVALCCNGRTTNENEHKNANFQPCRIDNNGNRF